MEVYLVGGAVRDRLLDLVPTEKDWVVVGSTPQQMLDQGYRQVGKDFPVFLHPETHEEYALARRERKQGAGYTGFDIDAGPEVTLKEDLLRRDLTINAMAQDSEGNIVDPYGGQGDLECKILRHVSDAFIEDPLRVLRVARFAARFAEKGFTIAPETLALMTTIVDAGELPTIAPERVWLETTKALKESKPSVFFQTLRDCGALKVVFPEVDALFGVPQRKDYHPEVDSGIHTLMVLDAAAKLSNDLPTRFAALTHDLGKAETPVDILPSHHGHEKRSVRLVKQLCERLRVSNAFRDIAVLVAEFHTHGHRALELTPGVLLKVFERIDIFRKPERIDQFIFACEADFRGRPGYESLEYPQTYFLREAADTCRNASAKDLQLQGLQGKEIAYALQRVRKQRIAAIKRKYVDAGEKFDNA